MNQTSSLPLLGHRIWQHVLTWPKLSALCAGFAAACGFQPLGLWPLTVFAMSVVLALAFAALTMRKAASMGWWFGVGLFALGNNWIATAFGYQSNMPSWMGWGGVILLAFYLAIYPALTLWVAKGVGRDSPLAFGLAAAGAWIITEWLRAWVLTGFAWNPLGVALLGGFDNPGLAVLTPWIGTYGLSGLAVLLAGSLWLWGRRLDAASLRWRVAGFGLSSAALITLMQVYAPTAEYSAGPSITLVQPDIRQEILNEPEYYAANMRKLMDLSKPEANERQMETGTRIVLWPESGVPDYLQDGYPEWIYKGNVAGKPAQARALLGRAIGRDSLLLTGSIDLEWDGDRPAGARNVVTAIDGEGAIIGSYAKSHLVPFGEYLPWSFILEPLGLARFVPGVIDFWPGEGPETLDLGVFGKAGVQICYEIIFSGETVDPQNRPDYIFNPSNDGWYGDWGPPQHLAQARLRAIEEGLPVLRSTTTGISAVIDAKGVVRESIGHERAGRVDRSLPAASEPTLFSQWGNKLPLSLAGLLLILSMVAMRLRRR